MKEAIARCIILFMIGILAQIELVANTTDTTKSQQKIFKKSLQQSLRASSNTPSTYLKVELPEKVIARSSYSLPKGINDHDEILLQAEGIGDAIWRKKTGQIDILDASYYRCIGNNGTVLGESEEWSNLCMLMRYGKKQDLNMKQSVPEFVHFDQCGHSPIFFYINDENIVFGNYTDKSQGSRAFIWKNGHADVFSPDDLILKGYNPINLSLIAVNKSGSILGFFDYGHKHPLKPTWMIDGTKYFLWSNKHSYIIDVSGGTACDLNDNDDVLINIRENDKQNCYIWSINNKLSLVTEDFSPFKFNNKRQIIGMRDGKHSVFSTGHFFDMSAATETYGGQIYFATDINNKGTILCFGKFWGEQHVFTLQIQNDASKVGE